MTQPLQRLLPQQMTGGLRISGRILAEAGLRGPSRQRQRTMFDRVRPLEMTTSGLELRQAL